ncbi:MAG: hypothetical protein WAN48_07750 [Actinomycetes bacterium]
MHSIQDPTAVATFGRAAGAFPFLSRGAPSPLYLGWSFAWIALMGALCAVSLHRRDL